MILGIVDSQFQGHQTCVVDASQDQAKGLEELVSLC